jgi:NAD(P)-dependent dehydrogenase (short-subunit alcohol dehydrogenase family)
MPNIAIITGAADGIGAHLALTLVKLHSYKVIVADVNDEMGKNIVKTLNNISKKSAEYAHCDVTKKQDLINLFVQCEKNFGSADVVINNAGIYCLKIGIDESQMYLVIS